MTVTCLPTGSSRTLFHALAVGMSALMLTACGEAAPDGPAVDHAKLSEELEARAAEIEASADESVEAVERELGDEAETMRANAQSADTSE